MWRTFNCGIGFVLIVPQAATVAIGAELDRLALPHWRIGEVADAGHGERVRIG
jgi:phosphoribosylformylglycinamidine cyclo-ligase